MAPEAGLVLDRAKEEAADLGSQWVAPEHVLLALLWSDDSRMARVFAEMHLKRADVRAAIERLGGPPAAPMMPCGPAGQWPTVTREMLGRGERLAKSQKSLELRAEHLLQDLEPAKGRLPAILGALKPPMQPDDFASVVEQVLAETAQDVVRG